MGETKFYPTEFEISYGTNYGYSIVMGRWCTQHFPPRYVDGELRSPINWRVTLLDQRSDGKEPNFAFAASYGVDPEAIAAEMTTASLYYQYNYNCDGVVVAKIYTNEPKYEKGGSLGIWLAKNAIQAYIESMEASYKHGLLVVYDRHWLRTLEP